MSLVRLFWRPVSLLGAFPLLLVISWPFIWLPNDTEGGTTVPIPLALWSHSIVVMGLLGALLSSVAREGHQPAFAFVVPSLRSSLLRAKLIVGVGVAFLIALAMLSAGEMSESAAVFGCGLMYFAIATAMTDPASPPIAAPAGFVIFVVSAFQPDLVRTLFGMAPVVAAIGSVTVAVLLLRREASVHAARSRAIQPVLPPRYRSVWPRSVRQAYAERRDHESMDWRATPATGRMRDWIAATHYEAFGWRPYGWLFTFGFQAVFLAGVAFALRIPAFAGWMGVLGVSQHAHRLLGKWPYPIARASRASLVVACNLMDAAAHAAVATATFWLLDLSGLPTFSFAPVPEANYPGLGIIPVFMLLAPLVQGVVIVSLKTHVEIFGSRRWGFQLFVHVVAVSILAHLTYRALASIAREASPALAFIVAGAVAIVVQAVYWFILRRHFARRDLA